MSKNKFDALLYPYSEETVFVFRYSHMINYCVKAVVVPGSLTKDKSILLQLEGLNSNDVMLSNNFSESLDLCNTVIWLPYNYYDREHYFETVKKSILYAISIKKNILCLEKLNESDLCKFVSFSKSNGVDFQYFEYNNSNYVLSSSLIINKIEIPIITILGVSEFVGKFEAQLFVRDALIQEGYKIAQIGSKHFSSFFGMQPFPHFMFDKNISEKDKILNFNNFICKIANDDKPDVIVIGIPGELIKLSNEYAFNFGITSFLSSCAYDSDFTILSMGCNRINNETLEDYKRIMKYKNSLYLDCLFVNNSRIDYNALKSHRLEIDVLPICMYKNEKEIISTFWN